MVSLSDVSSKQREVIEFILTENESITNIHRRSTNVYGDIAVDRSTVSRWAKRLASSEVSNNQHFTNLHKEYEQ
jgi:hypothetical protein